MRISSVPVRKSACCLNGSIKPPFYENVSGVIANGRKHPKRRVIIPFR